MNRCRSRSRRPGCLSASPGPVGHDRTVPAASISIWRPLLPPTHQVNNQVPQLVGTTLGRPTPRRTGWTPQDRPSRPASCGRSPSTRGRPVRRRGRLCGDSHPPVLRSYDRRRHRADQVDYDPAWRMLISAPFDQFGGLAVGTGRRRPRPLARAAGGLPVDRDRYRHLRPISMTFWRCLACGTTVLHARFEVPAQVQNL